MKMIKKSMIYLLVMLMTCILVACGGKESNDDTNKATETPSPTESIKTAEKNPTEAVPEDVVKTYPSREIGSELFNKAESLPAMAFSLPNGDKSLSGNVYYIEGTVTEHYDRMTDIDGLEAEPGTDAGMYNMEAFIVKTKDGHVVVFDFMKYALSSLELEYGVGSEEIAQVEEVYGHLENYNEIPSVGEKVKVYGLFFGNSSKVGMPLLCYGANPFVYDAVKHSSLGNNTPETTETNGTYYDYYDIRLQIPESWGENVINGEYTYFYPTGAFFMLSVYDWGADVTKTDTDEIMESFGAGMENYALNGYGTIKLADGRINAHVYEFDATLSGAYCQGQEVLFYRNGKIYSISYFDAARNPSSKVSKEFNDIVYTLKLK